MPKIIHGRQIIDDAFTLVTEGPLPSGAVCVSLGYFLENRSAVLSHTGLKGVQLKPDQHPELLGDAVTSLDMIALEFPAFADGRGYSYAWLLRNRLGFTGELRATGDVFKDNIYYLSRCGFDSFAVRADKNIEVALTGLDDFSEAYQASIDRPIPLFRRRLATAQ
ncbi:uncharacterized protein (DUF934 family) [Fluviicoccus keumensis]|uniref:Uncharacterized protein (DUF934 family) n=1 Tax=Fluviicoccus keumensis TaxID=1435465 RepID=A0A4V2G5M2_9GAMM|nr:DUF934 domain-containing protein [Fluviicoccus keumensis]RZU44876.1 uncharacterized protein (DUF934 family) [Fluviicoccus keumensis]